LYGFDSSFFQLILPGLGEWCLPLIMGYLQCVLLLITFFQQYLSVN